MSDRPVRARETRRHRATLGHGRVEQQRERNLAMARGDDDVGRPTRARRRAPRRAVPAQRSRAWSRRSRPRRRAGAAPSRRRADRRAYRATRARRRRRAPTSAGTHRSAARSARSSRDRPRRSLRRAAVRRTSRVATRVSASTSAPPIVQQMQPLSSSITSSPRARTSRASMFTAPKSLTSTAMRRPCGACRIALTTVVLPAPR